MSDSLFLGLMSLIISSCFNMKEKLQSFRGLFGFTGLGLGGGGGGVRGQYLFVGFLNT